MNFRKRRCARPASSSNERMVPRPAVLGSRSDQCHSIVPPFTDGIQSAQPFLHQFLAADRPTIVLNIQNNSNCEIHCASLPHNGGGHSRPSPAMLATTPIRLPKSARTGTAPLQLHSAAGRSARSALPLPPPGDRRSSSSRRRTRLQASGFPPLALASTTAAAVTPAVAVASLAAPTAPPPAAVPAQPMEAQINDILFRLKRTETTLMNVFPTSSRDSDSAIARSAHKPAPVFLPGAPIPTIKRQPSPLRRRHHTPPPSPVPRGRGQHRDIDTRPAGQFWVPNYGTRPPRAPSPARGRSAGHRDHSPPARRRRATGPRAPSPARGRSAGHRDHSPPARRRRATGHPRSPETLASRLLLHSVVQLRHQTESQVAREVAGPSRKGRGVPWLTRGPRAGHRSRRGVPLGEHRPWDGGPLCGLGAPVPSRAFTPARRAGSGLADSRWAGKALVQLGYASFHVVHSERKFQSHPTVPPGRLIESSDQLAAEHAQKLCMHGPLLNALQAYVGGNWQVEILPWVVSVLGLLDEALAQHNRDFLSVPLRNCDSVIDCAAIASVKELYFLHQLRCKAFHPAIQWLDCVKTLIWMIWDSG
jgi:hypothetical protein